MPAPSPARLFADLADDLKPAALDALIYGWWEAEQDRAARDTRFREMGGAL